MDPSLLAFNFSLGALAFFSPCGFPMLPAYLSYYLTRGDAPASVPRALARGLGGGLVAALGAVVILSAIALLAVALGAPFKSRVLWLELVGGLVLIGLGLAMLAGRGPRATFALRPSTKRGAIGLFAFGALYAMVAASCVAPLLIGAVAVALQEPTPIARAAAIFAYAAGMGTLLVAVTVLVSTAQARVLAVLKRILPHVERVGGVVLVLAGLYLLVYWANVAF